MPEVPPPSTTAPTGSALTGTVLAQRYELRALLAIGGMAEVWVGHDRVLDREVAVKVLHRHLAAEPDLLDRFRREAIAAAQLVHPNIVAVYDTASDQGLDAIVLELVRGPTLRQLLDQDGPLSPGEALRLGFALCDGLDVAHRAGFVHRDIKPANILRAPDGRYLLTDFGIAKAIDASERTATGAMLGSVKYLSPEQVEGKPVDGRSDLFAVGIVLYESLAGRVPWQADTPAATALARLLEDPPPLRVAAPTTPAPLVAAIESCLEHDAEVRPRGASQLRAMLRAAEQAAAAAPATKSVPAVTTHQSDPVTPPRGTTQVPTSRAHPPTGSRQSQRTPEPAVDSRVAAPPPRRRDRPPRRSWGAPIVLTTVVLAALVVAAALVLDSDEGRRLLGGSDAANAPVLPIVAVIPFDPEGTGAPGENDHLAPLAVDGDLTTTWRTESYEARDLGPKRGVGLAVTVDHPGGVHQLTVTSPTQGWSAQIYVADEPGADLEGWGEPVTSLQGDGGTTSVDLGGRSGTHVLVWITDLGESADRFRTEIAHLEIR